MRQAEVIKTLMSQEAAIRNLGVDALYLYGSHARDEARPDSDVDLFLIKLLTGRSDFWNSRA